MKTKSSIYSLLVAVTTGLALLCNCSGTKKEEAPVQVEEQILTTAQYTVDPAFGKQLGGVFSSYLLLKEAFVESDAAKVKGEVEHVKQALGSADMKLLSGEAHEKWMEYSNGMDKALMEMQSLEDIEALRSSFSTLSDNLFASLKAFGAGGLKAYYEYCPMAFDNKGAYWLSDNETIRNPYFGDKMLRCGSVKEVIE